MMPLSRYRWTTNCCRLRHGGVHDVSVGRPTSVCCAPARLFGLEIGADLIQRLREGIVGGCRLPVLPILGTAADQLTEIGISLLAAVRSPDCNA